MALAESLAAFENSLVPPADAELVENGDVFAIGAERINGLLGVVRVLSFAAVLNHGRTDAAIHKLLNGEDLWPAPVRLSQECFHTGEIAMSLGDVNDVVEIVVAVDVRVSKFEAAIVGGTGVGFHGVNGADELAHGFPCVFCFLDFSGLKTIGMYFRADDETGEGVALDIEVGRFSFAVYALGSVAGFADVTERSDVCAPNENPNLKFAGSLEENGLVLGAHERTSAPMIGWRAAASKG